MYDYPDPINAAIEIGRRAINWVHKKPNSFYPPVIIKCDLANRLKKDLVMTSFDTVQDWKELNGLLKTSGMRYRVPIPKIGFRQLTHYKSNVDVLYTLNINDT